jgi:hypothetical protein
MYLEPGELAKKTGLDKLNVDVVDELMNSHKEELSTEDSVQREKKQEEEEETAKAEEVRTLRSQRLAEVFHLVEEGSAILS